MLEFVLVGDVIVPVEEVEGLEVIDADALVEFEPHRLEEIELDEVMDAEADVSEDADVLTEPDAEPEGVDETEPNEVIDAEADISEDADVLAEAEGVDETKLDEVIEAEVDASEDAEEEAVDEAEPVGLDGRLPQRPPVERGAGTVVLAALTALTMEL